MHTSLFHRRLRVTALAGLGFATVCAQAQTAAADPRGRWISASGNLEVEVAHCGAALCGTVTRVLGNRSMEPGGAEMKATVTPPTQWVGQIYNRENGKTYRCTMSVSGASHAAGELVLHAYVGIPLFGKTQRWLRAPAEASATARR